MVLGRARTLGAPPRRTLVVGCEPQTVLDPTDEELLVELSPPVTAALDEAVTLVESVLEELTNEEARR
jgi:hydrogenase maturation protease